MPRTPEKRAQTPPRAPSHKLDPNPATPGPRIPPSFPASDFSFDESTTISPTKARAQARHAQKVAATKLWIESLFDPDPVPASLQKWEKELLSLNHDAQQYQRHHYQQQEPHHHGQETQSDPILKALQDLQYANLAADSFNQQLHEARKEELEALRAWAEYRDSRSSLASHGRQQKHIKTQRPNLPSHEQERNQKCHELLTSLYAYLTPSAQDALSSLAKSAVLLGSTYSFSPSSSSGLLRHTSNNASRSDQNPSADTDTSSNVTNTTTTTTDEPIISHLGRKVIDQTITTHALQTQLDELAALQTHLDSRLEKARGRLDKYVTPASYSSSSSHLPSFSSRSFSHDGQRQPTSAVISTSRQEDYSHFRSRSQNDLLQATPSTLTTPNTTTTTTARNETSTNTSTNTNTNTNTNTSTSTSTSANFSTNLPPPDEMQAQTTQWIRETKQITSKIGEYRDRIASMERQLVRSPFPSPFPSSPSPSSFPSSSFSSSRRLLSSPSRRQREQRRDYFGDALAHHTTSAESVDVSVHDAAVHDAAVHDVLALQDSNARVTSRISALEDRIRAFHGLPPDLAASREEVKRAMGEFEELKGRREDVWSRFVER